MNKKQKELFDKLSKLTFEEADKVVDDHVWQHFVETDKKPELVVLPKSIFGVINQYQVGIGYVKVKTV